MHALEAMTRNAGELFALSTQRDIRILIELDLIRRTAKDYKTNRHVVEAFLPPRAVYAEGQNPLDF